MIKREKNRTYKGGAMTEETRKTQRTTKPETQETQSGSRKLDLSEVEGLAGGVGDKPIELPEI